MMDGRTAAVNAPKRRLTNGDYSVGWICAIKIEYVAARAFLDEKSNNRSPCRPTIIMFTNWAELASIMLSLLSCLMGNMESPPQQVLQGICWIAFLISELVSWPSRKHDIRLGDIVVSAPRNGKGGVFQYDFGKTFQDQKFQTTGFLNEPPILLRAAVTDLAAQYEEEGHKLESAINSVLHNLARLRKNYKGPDQSSDRLDYIKVKLSIPQMMNLVVQLHVVMIHWI
jgi:hypothetical protein